MRIRWTVPAADDLENIKSYLQYPIESATHYSSLIKSPTG
jgi:hypothetical protein